MFDLADPLSLNEANLKSETFFKQLTQLKEVNMFLFCFRDYGTMGSNYSFVWLRSWGSSFAAEDRRSKHERAVTFSLSNVSPARLNIFCIETLFETAFKERLLD